tara:strand:+ start:327 stop:635 length:309 start_codon:yes stop_codon:yes gene_type:complete
MEILFFIPFLILFGIAISMVIHGWVVMGQHFGYQKNPSHNIHPEMRNVKQGEQLLVVKVEDQDYLDLQKRVKELKMQELFEEPSSYEDDDDDDGGQLVGCPS